MVDVALSGEVTVVEGTFLYGLTLGREIWSEPWGVPLDISANLGALHHLANNGVGHAGQFICFLNVEWTAFPWNRYLRTRFGAGAGLSYVTQIPYTERVQRDFRGSRRLLSYLEVSLSLNCRDLLTLIRVNRLFRDSELGGLEHAWLVGVLNHRSGGRGLFGDFINEDGEPEGVGEGSNYLSLGLAFEF